MTFNRSERNVRHITLNDVSGDLINDGRGGFIFMNVESLHPHMTWTKYGLLQLAEQIRSIAEEMYEE